MILLIDNYDSFTFNLQRYLVRLGQPVQVVRNDAPELDCDLARHYSALVLSPGPKGPKHAGKCLDIVRAYSGRLPILGVCLGHQVVIEAFGGVIGPAQRPMHGQTSEIELYDSRLFFGIDNRCRVARYHSLIGVEASLPSCLRVTARSPELEIMAVEHVEDLTFGVQFHPESVLSQAGYKLLNNFLLCAGLNGTASLPEPDFAGQLSDTGKAEILASNQQPVVLPLPSR